MNDIQLIARIKRVMDSMGMNVSEFSRLTDINQSNMSSMLNGKRKIGDAIINKIVLSFDINKDWLLTGEGEMKKESNSIVSEPMVSYGEKGSIKEITIPLDVWEVIKMQAKSLEKRDSQIDELISLLKDSKKDTADIA